MTIGRQEVDSGRTKKFEKRGLKMQADFYAKKKKTPDQVRDGQKRRDSFKSKTATKAKRGPKRTIGC